MIAVKDIRTVRTRGLPWAWCAMPAAVLLTACGGVSQQDAVFRLPASYNFSFYDQYEAAARSFYAAHFTHFRAYEVLLIYGADPDPQMVALREKVYRYIADPPRFEPPADVIAPEWMKIAFATGQAMDWTHMLHSQLYDILADDRVSDKKSAGERAIAYYLANSRSAFSTRGYGHRWMEAGGPWAGEFRRSYPDVNGILWAYHWHHAAVYEALMEEDPERRRERLDRVIEVFTDSVLLDPPQVMPLTAEVAPRFSAMFPAAAQIFDNLHMMHDVVNDVMADGSYDRARKTAEIERMLGLMLYAGQDTVVAPGMPHAGHEMHGESVRVPTQLDDGSWLPQGHPDAREATAEELARPLPPVIQRSAAAEHRIVRGSR